MLGIDVMIGRFAQSADRDLLRQIEIAAKRVGGNIAIIPTAEGRDGFQETANLDPRATIADGKAVGSRRRSGRWFCRRSRCNAGCLAGLGFSTRYRLT